MRSTREGYGKALLDLGKNKKVVALSADLTGSTKANYFAEKYPSRFFQCGVAEQNMISMSAGLALEGKIPFASTFGVFVLRALDQIRMNVCYNQSNVKIVATHCGLATGEDGATHQALEDVAALRSLPGITIIEPCDYKQAFMATKSAAKINGPVYLRLHRGKFNDLKTSGFKIGKAQVLKKGSKLTIISSGPIINEVLKASELVKGIEIINCHTIKPLDDQTILKSVRKTKKVIVVQDHQKIGGLGSAICELLSEKYPVKTKVIGVKDRFTESGSPSELWRKYGLSSENIIKEIKKII
jgi:transketolase